MEFSAEFVQVPPVRNYELRESRRSEDHTLLINDVNEFKRVFSTFLT
jgi:hypothetical protein